MSALPLEVQIEACFEKRLTVDQIYHELGETLPCSVIRHYYSKYCDKQNVSLDEYLGIRPLNKRVDKPKRGRKPIADPLKQLIINDVVNKHLPAKTVAAKHGVSIAYVYTVSRPYRDKTEVMAMDLDTKDMSDLPDDPQKLKEMLMDMRLERDLYRTYLDIVKKAQGVDLQRLTNS